MNGERFWMKSWDPGVADLDPQRFETSYVDAIRKTFEDFPDMAALSFLGVQVTYAELDRYSNRLAHMLASQGLGKGDVVGINLPNIPEYVIVLLGSMKAGCATTGVSPLLSTEEMEYQLKDSGAKALVTLDAIFAGRLTKFADRVPDLELVLGASVGGFLPGFKRFMGKLLGKIPKGKLTELPGKTVMKIEEVIKTSKYPDTLPQVKVSPDDIACIQYTGGTTGSPKGAVLTHRNAVSDLLIVQDWLGWERGKGVALSCFPMFHIAGLAFAANCIYLGRTQVLIPNPRDTDMVCRELEKWKPSVMANVPSLYQMLINNPAFKTLDHSNLETCVSAAAPFPEESQRVFESIVGEGKLMELYGMSETSPITTMNPYKNPKKLGSIGLPLPNTDVKLVDPGTGQTVEVGQPGEICIKGPMVMQGYHNKPEETANAIDPDGYLHTGDVAVFDPEGYLRIVDRTKDMIIVSGFKVFSKHVEEKLSEHPAIGMVATIGLPNPERPGSEIVKAYVSLDPDYAFDGDEKVLKAELAEFAKKHLTPYESPKIWEFAKELPLTPIGKVDKKALRKLARP